MSGSDDATRESIRRSERLLDAGRLLVPGADLDEVLRAIAEAARDLSGASFAVIEVFDHERPDRTRVVTAGVAHVDDAARDKDLPDGTIDVPISVRGRHQATLRLAPPPGAAVDPAGSDALATLAGWAAVAIDTTHLLNASSASRTALDRALRTSRTAMEIATAIGEDTDLTRTLALIVQRGRTLVDADGLLIWLRHHDELRIAAVSGNAEVPPDAAIPLDGSTAGKALRSGRSVRVDDARDMQISPAEFGMFRASSALVVPLVHHGRGLGVLVAFDRHGAIASFDADNQRALEAFAASAATAVATARLVEEQRLQDSMAAAEAERARWARELHDETLQGLASLKLTLAGARKADPDTAREVLTASVEQLGHDIAALQAIIADLRPAVLDDLGLGPALRTLVAGVAEAAGLVPRVSVDVGDVRLGTAIETVAYRVAQEALTNVVKHAGARTVAVHLALSDAGLRLLVTDDGRGAAAESREGYGILGMRERAASVAGDLHISKLQGGGTRVTLQLPVNSSQ